MDDFGLTAEIKKLNDQLTRLNRRLSLGYGFLHGIFVGLGTTIGVAIILAVTGFILQKLLAPYFPFIQGNLERIFETINQNRPR